MSYTLDHLHWALAHGRVGLTIETAAFIVLSAAEQLQSSPRQVDNAAIMLTEAGAVLLADMPPTQPRRCDETLRTVLAQLAAQCRGEHPAIEGVTHGKPVGPSVLAKELQAALIPINRSAARRALVRLHRRLDAAGPPPHVEATTRPLILPADTEPARVATPPMPLAQSAPLVGPPVRASDATPCLGSYAVAPVARQEAELVAVRGTPPGDSPRAMETAMETLSAVEVSPVVDVGNLIVTARGPDGRRPGAAFSRFSSRRSDVRTLVGQFSIETATEAERVAEELRRCVSGDAEGELVCTPLAPAVREAS